MNYAAEVACLTAKLRTSITEELKDMSSNLRVKNPERNLSPGHRYTIGPNKTIRDRSYTDNVLLVTHVNGGHAAVEVEGRTFAPRTAMIVIEEHDWYAADHFPRKES